MLQKVKDGFAYGIGVALALTVVSVATGLLVNLGLLLLGLLMARPVGM